MNFKRIRRWAHRGNRIMIRLCPGPRFLRTAEEVGHAMIESIYGVECPPIFCTFFEPVSDTFPLMGSLCVGVTYFDNRVLQAIAMGRMMARWSEANLQSAPDDNMPYSFIGEWIGIAILAAAYESHFAHPGIMYVSKFAGVEIENEPIPAQGPLAFVAWFIRGQTMPYPMTRADLLEAWNEVRHEIIAIDQYGVLVEAAYPRVVEWLHSANSDRRIS